MYIFPFQGHPPTCQNVSEMCQNVSECVRNVSEMCQNVSECVRMCLNVSVGAPPATQFPLQGPFPSTYFLFGGLPTTDVLFESSSHYIFPIWGSSQNIFTFPLWGACPCTCFLSRGPSHYIFYLWGPSPKVSGCVRMCQNVSECV